MYLRFQQAQNRRVLHNALPYVGLCRVEFDPRPHFIEDRIRLQLANPNASCRFVPTRDHFIEDLVAEQITQGLSQFVIFAAELDT